MRENLANSEKSGASIVMGEGGDKVEVTKADAVDIAAPDGYMWYNNRLVTMACDVNGDKVVNEEDLAALVRHVAKISLLTDEQLKIADLNGDKQVDAADVTILAQMLEQLRAS